jgi:hypothetical protein
MLRDVQELSYQEIADQLHLPEGTVKSASTAATELARQISAARELEEGRMNLTTDQVSRRGHCPHRRDAHDMPRCCRFSRAVSGLLAAGDRRSHRPLRHLVDSAIGCLMDLYRQTRPPGAPAAGRR